jgi:ribonuclease P protein component
VIWRIRDRAVFARFRRDGRRVRVGSLWMSLLADPTALPPRVAFAVGRSVGTAPVRNRVRRRLRALARSHASELAPGWYLIGADARFGSLPAPQADADFTAALEALAGPGRAWP